MADLLHKCADLNEQPSNIKTMAIFRFLDILFKSFFCRGLEGALSPPPPPLPTMQNRPVTAATGEVGFRTLRRKSIFRCISQQRIRVSDPGNTFASVLNSSVEGDNHDI